MGATLIVNLSCSDEIIGKAAYRRTILQAKSGSLLCAYAYADAGMGESTLDMVFAVCWYTRGKVTLFVKFPVVGQMLLWNDAQYRTLIADRCTVINCSGMPDGQTDYTNAEKVAGFFQNGTQCLQRTV